MKHPIERTVHPHTDPRTLPHPCGQYNKKFYDFAVKDAVLCKVYSQKQITFRDKPIYLDHDGP